MIKTRGVDISEGADLTAGTLKTWRNSGIRRLYVQYSGKLAYYLERVSDESWLTVDVYVYLYFPLSPWNQSPENRVDAALRIIEASGVAVRYVWLDVEDSGDRGSPADYIGAIHRCGDRIEKAGYKPGLYTGRSSFITRMGNYDGFAKAGWPLWHANYVHGQTPPPEVDLDREPDDFWGNTAPYAGYEKPFVRQWHGTSLFGGHSVDMDIEDSDEEEPEQVPEGPEGDEDDMKFVLPEPGKAEWWEDRVLDTEADDEPENSELDAVKDLHAEPGDIARFVVNLINGHVFFYHGVGDLVAGVAEGEGNHEVEAQVDPAGKIRFEIVEPTEVAELYSVGNWR